MAPAYVSRPAARLWGMGRLGVIVVLLGVLLGGGAVPALGQLSRQEVERQKRENAQRMAAASRILEDVSRQREATLGQLTALQSAIKARQTLIEGVQTELNLLSEEIALRERRTTGLTEDLTRLRREYAAMVYAAAKTSALDKLLYIVASEDINQAVARVQYLRQYSRARQAQARQIEGVRAELLSEKSRLEDKRREQEALLSHYQQERRRLSGEQDQQQTLVKTLESRQDKLRTELRRRQEADRRLERIIADIVRREVRRANAERLRAERAAASRPSTAPRSGGGGGAAIPEGTATAALTETERASASFSEVQGRLSWPVDAGFVSGRFGRRPHPLLKGVVEDNLGIKIQTRQGERVYGVFGGQVEMVAEIPGVEGRVVFVRHGEYFTVYSNLSDVRLEAGQTLKARQQIGTVATDRAGLSEMQFQIWRGNQRIDPEQWLSQKPGGP